MNKVIIKSSNSSATLTFQERDGEYFSVVYDSPAIQLNKRVWGYTDCSFLIELFSQIAKEWKGWKGSKSWESIEGEFGVKATCDNLGHVTLNLSIREWNDPEPWDVNVDLVLDTGQTERVSKQINSFFTN